MKSAMRKWIVVGLAALMTLATVGTALADQPPGQLGFEGQPGHQGGGGGSTTNNNSNNPPATAP